MLDDALVVITSDHGQRTSEGGLLYHGGEADGPTLNIPLLVYDRRANPYPTRPAASQVDVAPTILRSIGLAAPDEWKGEPLQDAIERKAVPVGTSESTGAVVLREGAAWLYLCNRDTGAETVAPLKGAAAPLSRSALVDLRRYHLQAAAPVRDGKCRSKR
jgi:arylsulfatase A-like enzyme